MGKYDTQLPDDEEKRFQAWKQIYAPKDSGADYDLRGAYRAGLKPDPNTGHWPDTYKKPNHPTFSNESIYAKDRPDLAGRWEGNQYVSPPSKSFFAAATGAAGGPTALTAGLAELEGLRKNLFSPKNNVIIPTTGAAQYWYVDPRATASPSSMPVTHSDLEQNALYRANPNMFSPPHEDQGQLDKIGLLPKNAPIMLNRNVLGNAPRLAQDDRKELLKDIDTAIYGGSAPAPTPTPAGTPRLAGGPSQNARQTDQWYRDMVHSYFQRPPSLDRRYNPDPESGQFQPQFVPGSRQYPNIFLT